MDALSCSLTSNCLGNNNPVFNINGKNFNHLMYVDDLLVFGMTKAHNATNLMNILTDFADSSGLNINPTKSSIIFSNNTVDAEQFCSIMGIIQRSSFLTYLGIPISPERLKANHFQVLLDKIISLLEGWKVRFLSLAGRVQFLKFTISNTLAYWIKGSIIPKAICKTINKLCSKFLFHGEINGKKVHMIAWENTVIPKQNGGLGIVSIDACYYSYHCTFIWNLLTQDSLIYSWFKNKYYSPWKPPVAKASKFWKVICSTAYKIKNHFSFNINSTSKFSLCWDPLINGKSLSDFFQINQRFTGLSVNSCIRDNVWTLPDYFPDNMKHAISAIEIKEQPALAWDGSLNPNFKNFLNSYYTHLEEVNWHKYVWYKSYSLRYSILTWMAILQKLKVADLLIKKSIQVNPVCCLCNNAQEDHNHLFFNCDFTFNVINKLIPELNSFLLKPNLIQVFDYMDNQLLMSKWEKNFCWFTIGCTVYHLWRERNNRKFANKWNSTENIIITIKNAIRVKTCSWKHFHHLIEKFQFY
ncbi:hypothetical protein KFK09_022889 [Dendrobium nobile]|uniref:Reverse transcriptase domain-containing protein n=1 Tax=Dendrobium nobile TaxID=94219 RepID=A0A8T3AJK0_DENNO|nr:hypothetical protein KFK09_022889 [Dendrobium nobile]